MQVQSIFLSIHLFRYLATASQILWSQKIKVGILVPIYWTKSQRNNICTKIHNSFYHENNFHLELNNTITGKIYVICYVYHKLVPKNHFLYGWIFSLKP